MSQNQYPEELLRLSPEIERVKDYLRAGRPPSEIANALHAKGLSNIELILVFRAATGASIGDLKSLGQWWSELGVTDAPAFDSAAVAVFRKHGVIAG
jgi:hypothetical protein